MHDHAEVRDAVADPSKAADIPYAVAAPLGVMQNLLFDYGLEVSSNGHSMSTFGGERVPKYTLGVIEYLDSLDLSSKRVFEFGGGGSTIWWSHRAKEVISVETSQEWVAKIAPQLPANAKMHLRESAGEAARSIQDFDGVFDVVLIDGAFSRFQSAESTMGVLAGGAAGGVHKLAKGGIVLVDDADWVPRTSRCVGVCVCVCVCVRGNA